METVSVRMFEMVFENFYRYYAFRARVVISAIQNVFLTENKTVQFVFALAICFIYLVMAAQFEVGATLYYHLKCTSLFAGAVITLGLIKGDP